MLNVRGIFTGAVVFVLASSAFAGPPATPAAAPAKPAPAKAQAAPAAAAREVAGEVVSVDGVVFVRADTREKSPNLQPARPGDVVYSGDIVNTSSNGKVKILLKDKSIVDLGPSALFKLDHFAKNAGADRELDVSMIYGTMRAAVPQKIEGKGRFRVRTPTATMGVRGTEFVVKSEIKSLEEMKQALRNPGKPLVPPKAQGLARGPDGKTLPKIEGSKTEITVLQGKVEVAKPVLPADLAGRKPGSIAPPPQIVALTAGMQISSQTGESVLSKPITLDTKQLASIVAVAKLPDNTFTKAVVIDTSPQPGGSQNGQQQQQAAASGTATLKEIGALTGAGGPAVTAPKPSDVIPGAFNNTVAPPPPPIGNRHLRVIINSF